jgi:hypothetical protein
VKNVKTKRNLVLTTILTLLIASIAIPVLAEGSSNQESQVQLSEQNGWKIIQTDVITVLFPSGGAQPMFLWWYKNQTDKVYLVKYQGLYEFFAFDTPLYYFRHTYLAEWEWLRLRFMGTRWNMMPMQLRMALANVYENWHDPYLPFSGSQWQLSDIKNITADGNVIGLAFAFKLVQVPWWKQRFEFAENNIMIRCRFYFEPVTEVVDGHEYTVNVGEMKQDIAISNWKWNLDTLKPLLEQSKEHNVTIPEGRTGLALAINLASINVTKITPEQAETVEDISTTSSMAVESSTVSVVQNRTLYDETPIPATKRLYERYRIRFIKTQNDTSLAGFFDFVSAAKVIYPDGSVQVINVTASYAEAGSHLELFLCYPYFSNGTLEHDPSFGLDVPETTTPEATTPLYRVDVPSGLTQVKPKVLLPLSTIQLAAIAVGAVTVIALIIYAFKWKRKTPVNMVGTR